MNKFIIAIIILLFNNTISFSTELTDCSSYSKFSAKFYACKTGNFVKDTKNFQQKEWSDENKKIKKIKKKILE